MTNEEAKPKFERFPLRRIADSKNVKPFERGTRPRDHIYASELGACARAVWFKFHYPTEFDKTYSERRGAVGHAIENLHAEQVKGLLVAREVSFYDEVMHVSGRVDFVLRTTHDGPMIPEELKTTIAFDHSMCEPFSANVYQLLYYISQIPEAPYGLLTYFNLASWKDDEGNSRMGEWETLLVPRDDEEVKRRAAYLWKVVHKEEPPNCEYVPRPKYPDCFECSVSPEALMKKAKQ